MTPAPASTLALDARFARELPELARRPHAWPKLWRHHAAQPEAEGARPFVGIRIAPAPAVCAPGALIAHGSLREIGALIMPPA